MTTVKKLLAENDQPWNELKKRDLKIAELTAETSEIIGSVASHHADQTQLSDTHHQGRTNLITAPREKIILLNNFESRQNQLTLFHGGSRANSAWYEVTYLCKEDCSTSKLAGAHLSGRRAPNSHLHKYVCIDTPGGARGTAATLAPVRVEEEVAILLYCISNSVCTLSASAH
ncbi:hypothetical protein GQ600_21357 [Phytophthora cactorum]|nr:hypothetical protein GQ600_21357 [Phytophthora cactorum]